MVHPSELLRSNSSGDEGSFVAPVGDYRNDVDCGFTALPCLSQRLNLEKYAKPTYFVALLSFAGLFSGIAVKYFRGTSQIWSKHYDIPRDTIEWLVYINEVFVGIFALVVAYWGNKIHRPNWIGALTVYLGVSCIILAIPEIYQPYSGDETNIDTVNGRVLCQNSTSLRIKNLEIDINNQVVAFIILILHQVVYALFYVSFVCHGITYIDDNTSKTQSPAFIALVFAAQRIGKQSGIYSSWMPYIFNSQSIFVTWIWILVAVTIFLFGCFLAMFPRIMPNTLLRKSVNSLLSLASGHAVMEQKTPEDGFLKSLWRILKNKVLLLNIVAIMFIQAAIINFNIKEKHFNQSKYHVSRYNDVSGYSDPTLIQFSTNLLKQPLIAVSYIAMGMIIAKMKPRARYLVMWNIKVFIVILLGFAGIRFFTCTNKLQNELGGRLTIPYCSWKCGCSLDGPFQPICLNGKTHFSPCWAGCTSFDQSLRLYENCTCAGNDRNIAAEGSCDADSCSTLWALAQAHGVVSSALLGTTFISSLIISIRCVKRRDKALALGLYLTIISLIPYLPVRAIYDIIADNFCEIFGKKSCQFYSDNFALFISIITLCLKALAILVSIGLLYIIDKVELYTNNNSRKGSDEDLSFLRRTGAYNSNIYIDEPRTTSNNNNNENGPAATSREPAEEASALIQSPNDILVRHKQRSDSKLDKMIDRTSKGERINAYLSEGDLVPPLKSNLRLGKSESKTSNSNNSVLSTDSSLSAIANTVGDDHDSDFSSLQHPQKVKLLQKELQEISEAKSVPKRNGSSPKFTRSSELKNNIQETEF